MGMSHERVKGNFKEVKVKVNKLKKKITVRHQHSQTDDKPFMEKLHAFIQDEIILTSVLVKQQSQGLCQKYCIKYSKM